MMPVQAVGVSLVKTLELVELSCNDVLEGTGEPGVKDDLCKWMPQQVRGDLVLVFREPRGTRRRGKRHGKVKVKARVEDPSLPSNHRRALRIFHEDHRADRRNGSPGNAIERSLRGLVVSSPIIGVYDEKTGLKRTTTPGP